MTVPSNWAWAFAFNPMVLCGGSSSVRCLRIAFLSLSRQHPASIPASSNSTLKYLSRTNNNQRTFTAPPECHWKTLPLSIYSRFLMSNNVRCYSLGDTCATSDSLIPVQRAMSINLNNFDALLSCYLRFEVWLCKSLLRSCYQCLP